MQVRGVQVSNVTGFTVHLMYVCLRLSLVPVIFPSLRDYLLTISGSHRSVEWFKASANFINVMATRSITLQ